MIPIWIPALAFLIGILGLVFKFGIAKQIGSLVGTPLGVKVNTVFLIFIVVGFALGGITTLMSYGTGFLGGATATISGEPELSEVIDYTGFISVKLDNNALSNTTSTEDFVNDAKDFLTIYSADANILDGEEYQWNITVDRTNVAYAGTVKVTCSIADKEIDGVTSKNLAEKTSGKIDLDIDDTGTFIDDNTVTYLAVFAAGDGSIPVAIAFDQEETYHDGMTDMDDYVDTICIVEDGDQSLTTTMRVKANS